MGISTGAWKRQAPVAVVVHCTASRSTESQVFSEQLTRLQAELRSVEESRGARELLEAISGERLLVVGHCCFYDFLHLYQSFVE